MRKRNLLCIKQKNALTLGEQLLYEPYKNILREFRKLSLEAEAHSFDPIAKVFDGISSAPNDIRYYYEALLGVTSYYQHSQGGRGRYIEKRFASSFQTCSLDVKLSELPLWLEFPEIYKKRRIFTQQGLSPEEKRVLKKQGWEWLGEKDITIDLGSLIKEEKAVIFLELKNRIDTGGVAGRREIWTSKYSVLLDYLESQKKLFRKNNQDFTLAELLLEYFEIDSLEIYQGILFDSRSETPATLDLDKMRGFYSTSKQCFKNILQSQWEYMFVTQEDLDHLQIEIALSYSPLKIKIGALYGNDIPSKIFRNHLLSLSDLLLLKYDDAWLSQLIAIDERSHLLKYGRNFASLFEDLLKKVGSLACALHSGCNTINRGQDSLP